MEAEGLKKRKSLIFISLAVIAVVGAVILLTYDVKAHPGSIYVDDDAPSGWYDATHVKTIQEGVDNASVGDTIYVWDGTYTENVNVNKTVTLIGNGTSVTMVNAVNTSDHVFHVTVDYVNISGFTITGATGTGRAGIYLNSSVSYCNISDNTISHNDYGIRLVSSSYNTITGNNASNNFLDGIWLLGSSNNTITGNTANNNGVKGIYLEGSSNNNHIAGNTANNNTEGIWLGSSNNNNIIGNNASHNHENGIWLKYSSYNNITGNTANNNKVGISLKSSSSKNNNIAGNNASNNNEYGIYLQRSSNNNITGNNVSHNNKDGIRLDYSQSKNNDIIGNTANNNRDGISLYKCGINTITGNNVSHNNKDGIRLRQSSNNTITGNNVSHNNRHGIYLSESSNNNITWNTIQNNIATPTGLHVDPDSDDNEIHMNCFIDNIEQAWDDGLRNNWDNNYWSDSPVEGQIYYISGGSAGSQDHFTLGNCPTSLSLLPKKSAQVPSLTPTGMLILIGLISLLAALIIKKKNI